MTAFDVRGLTAEAQDRLLLRGAVSGSFFHPLAMWYDRTGAAPDGARLRAACEALAGPPVVPPGWSAGRWVLTTPIPDVYLTVRAGGDWIDHLGYAMTLSVEDRLFEEADAWFAATGARPLFVQEPALTIRRSIHDALECTLDRLRAAYETASVPSSIDAAEAARRAEYMRALRAEVGDLGPPGDDDRPAAPGV